MMFIYDHNFINVTRVKRIRISPLTGNV